MVLAALLTNSVPEPSFVYPAVPISVENIIAEPVCTSLVSDATPVSVEFVTVYPLVLKVRLPAVCGASKVAVPAVPMKTASLPSVQVPRMANVPSHQLLTVIPAVHDPVPPSPAPVLESSPTALLSVSQ